MLRGALAACVTPLRDGGEALDAAAIPAYVDFLVQGGLDGVLVLGTTGEGILLRTDERRRAAEEFVAAAGGRLQVAVHCGAQTTAEAVSLAEHAVEAGADAVAVIGPPYYAFDERALLGHFRATAQACRPLPFYLYEFAARTGYAVPISVVEALRSDVPNLAGLKVSDQPLAQIEPYLLEGLDVFIGAEPLLVDGLARGAAGAVSGLAAAFPALVADLVRRRDPDIVARVAELRRELERFPFQAAVKRVLRHHGVPVREDVRAPLRGLTDGEREALDRWLESS